MRPSSSLVVVALSLVVCGCGSEERKPATAPPTEKAPSPAVAPPRIAPPEDEGKASVVERSPVPADARSLLEAYSSDALDAPTVSRGFERVLAPPRDELLTAGPGWRVSRRRAVVHAIRSAPALLRDALCADEDPRVAATIADVGSYRAHGTLARACALSERYPASSIAVVTWEAIEKARATPQGPFDASTLPPVAPGLSVSGIVLEASGDDGILAEDGDRNRVWEHRAGTGAKLHALGVAGDRLVLVEVAPSAAGSAVSVVALDVATGDEVARVTAFTTDPASVRAALVGECAVVAGARGTSTDVTVVDVLVGRLAWERTVDGRRALVSAASTGVSLEGVRLDLATGRRLAEGSSRGSIDVR